MNWGAILTPMKTVLKREPEIQAIPDSFGSVGWYRVALKTAVRKESTLNSAVVSYLTPGKSVHVVEVKGRRAQIDLPVTGWVSMVSRDGQYILEAVKKKIVAMPMPSEIFGDSFGEAEYDEDGSVKPDEIPDRLEDRNIVLLFLNDQLRGEAVFERFQLSSTNDLVRIQYFYCALVSAYASSKLGDNLQLLLPKHVSDILNRFMPKNYEFGWSDFEVRLGQARSDYELFNKTDKLIPWDAAPLVRAAQEFIKKYEDTACRPQFPDAIHVVAVNNDTDGIFVCSGYFNKKPLYVRGNGRRCIRWYEDSWYIDETVTNKSDGIAKLEVNCPHPASSAKAKWLIFDPVTSSWRKKSSINLQRIDFSNNAL